MGTRRHSAKAATLWAEPKDLHLHNLYTQSFKGRRDCTAAKLFNQEPFLHNFVTIRTGDTLNPELDIGVPRCLRDQG